MTREAALHTLLGGLFSSEELRTHLALEREGDELIGSLPEGVSRAALVTAAIEALRRRGIIDRDFFDRLEEVRTRRRSEIRQVRARWLHNPRLDRGEVWAEQRYELVDRRGGGGFGLVWKAIDTWTGTFVALKILHDMHADDRRIRQRFFRGAEVLARLSHPAIVRVRSSVEQEGLRFFYVMEYLDGECLDALVGAQPRETSLAHVFQIGEALGHIHACDLLHRDIKPSNILITTRGQAKLIDFDLVTGDAFAPLTTRALGTAIYAPPEAGANDRKTAAYDVYSLARTAEFVIRGRAPTVAELVAVDPVVGLDAADAVKTVLRAALCTEPSTRTQSVEQFCSNLRAALAPLPTIPGPPVELPVSLSGLPVIQAKVDADVKDRDEVVCQTREAVEAAASREVAEAMVRGERQAREASEAMSARQAREAAEAERQAREAAEAEARDEAARWAREAAEAKARADQARDAAEGKATRETAEAKARDEATCLARKSNEATRLARESAPDSDDPTCQADPQPHKPLSASMITSITKVAVDDADATESSRSRTQPIRVTDLARAAASHVEKIVQAVDSQRARDKRAVDSQRVRDSRAATAAAVTAAMAIARESSHKPAKPVDLNSTERASLTDPRPSAERARVEATHLYKPRSTDSSANLPAPIISSHEQAEQRWGIVIADRYRVEDLLVFDGSGALYRARDTERGVPCALRVLPEVYARDEEIHARFARDARAAQDLMHPNIAQVFDIGKLEDGAVYAVTELLLADGQSLATIIQEEGRLSPPRAVHVATQVCRALGTAHEAGIIHRDLTPSKVMLVAQEGDLDFVKVVDFGIVSHVDSEPTTSVSQQDLIVGSPDYMAPEQAAGAEASPASDIYALGVVLYEMLTGKRPYSGRNAIDILIQKGAHDAARVTDIQPDVPEGLADVVAWCLARLPEDRPASMRALEKDLMRALDPSTPRPTRSAVAAALAEKRQMRVSPASPTPPGETKDAEQPRQLSPSPKYPSFQTLMVASPLTGRPTVLPTASSTKPKHYIYAAMVSVLGHIIVFSLASISPVGPKISGLVALLIYYVLPSVRVLIDRRRYHFMVSIQWIWTCSWIPLMCALLLAIGTALMSEPGASDYSSSPWVNLGRAMVSGLGVPLSITGNVVVFFVSVALGAFANIYYLRMGSWQSIWDGKYE